uniref:Uncharacterized protein n=1 Tax=viral metagenome TaxID=1070528 RepID=A0A6M3IEY7_9ZZZZ
MGKANIYWSAIDRAWIIRDGAGNEVTRFTGAGQTIPTGRNLTITDGLTKANLASTVYQEVVLSYQLTTASKTFQVHRLWSAGTVVRVTYWTNQAIGTSEGIDILDGGTDGAGTDVIDSCSNNLSGLDCNTLSTPYALSAGDYICIKTDGLVSSSVVTVTIVIKVPLYAET